MASQEIGKLSEDEQKLFDCVKSGSLEEVKALLGQPGIRVDCLDQNGMTPLQQAAFHAQNEVCKLLLTHGADVNSNNHQNGYTALMFAALSGNTLVTQTLLEAGANVFAENTVHRTASQMAAFIGQSQCTVVINNFFPKSDLEFYCQPHDLETEAKLPAHLCNPLYELIKQYNINPVKLSMVLQSHPEILDDAKKVQRVLDLLVEKMIKKRECNEIMAIKFHYLSVLVGECAKWQADKKDNLEGWIKRLCKGRSSDCFLEIQERLIRSAIKSFPYLDSQLLQEIVKTLASVEIGDNPTAFHTLNSALSGHQFAAMDGPICNTCGDLNAAKKCSACKAISYCNVNCQKLDWPNHKKQCKNLLEQRLASEKKKAEAQQKSEHVNNTENEKDDFEKNINVSPNNAAENIRNETTESKSDLSSKEEISSSEGIAVALPED